MTRARAAFGLWLLVLLVRGTADAQEAYMSVDDSGNLHVNSSALHPAARVLVDGVDVLADLRDLRAANSLLEQVAQLTTTISQALVQAESSLGTEQALLASRLDALEGTDLSSLLQQISAVRSTTTTMQATELSLGTAQTSLASRLDALETEEVATLSSAIVTLQSSAISAATHLSTAAAQLGLFDNNQATLQMQLSTLEEQVSKDDLLQFGVAGDLTTVATTPTRTITVDQDGWASVSCQGQFSYSGTTQGVGLVATISVDNVYAAGDHSFEGESSAITFRVSASTQAIVQAGSVIKCVVSTIPSGFGVVASMTVSVWKTA